MMNYFVFLMIDAAAGLLSMLPFLIVLEILARRQIPSLPLKHIIGDGVFCLFLSAILSITGIPAIYGLHFNPNINLLPFADLTGNGLQYIENLLLFVPVGLLLPALFSRFQKRSRCVAFGFFFSLSVEIMQLFSFRATDIDDLLMNTLGTLTGFALFTLLRRLCPSLSQSFLLPQDKLNELPALFELEAHILAAASWAGALLFTSAVTDLIWTLLLY